MPRRVTGQPGLRLGVARESLVELRGFLGRSFNMNTKTFNAQRDLVALRLLPMLLITAAFIVPLASACRQKVAEQSASIVVNAPSNGVIRRVVVNADAVVDKDAALIEIAVQPAHTGQANPANTKASQAAAASAQTDLASAEGEANRIALDVRRIEPLVKRGLASQAELDKARSQSLDAQERLRLAREKANHAEADRNKAASTGASEEIVVVRAPAAGTVQSVSVLAGQVVVIGQPVATLVSNT
jgi:multidrug resistance efflux pump